MKTIEQIWPHLVYNDSGEFIPPFGCVRITGVTESDRGRALFSVDLPRGPEAGAPANVDDAYLFVGPQGIAAGQYGNATASLPAPVAHVGTPLFGDSWGPIAGQFTVGASGNGYRVLGASVRGVVMVGPIDQRGGGGEVVRVYNDSQLTRERGAITCLDSPLNTEVNNQDPADDTLFTRPVLFNYLLPITERPFAVLIEDCEYEATVDAVCVGVVAVKIDYTDEKHTRADCIQDEPDFLKSGTTGRVAILWREKQDRTGSTSLGEQWALVYFDGGGKSGTSGGVTLTLAKMISTGPKASWPGCAAPDSIAMQSGQAHVYVSDGDGKIKLAEPPEGLSGDDLDAWNKANKPKVYNYDSLVDLKNGALVVLSAARFGKSSGGGVGGGGSTSGGGGGATSGGGGGGSVGDDGGINIAEGETIYIASYARAVDYLAALSGFGAKKLLASDAADCTGVKWLGEECQ